MILLLDNYDSFVHNLARYCQELGQETVVLRNDAVTIDEVAAMGPQAVLLSPGPCGPNEAGISCELVRRLGASIPMLGICLGHQVIAAACGGDVVRAREPMHGKTSLVYHRGEHYLFRGLPNPMRAGRYHSLVAEPTTLPPALQTIATTEDGTVMALAHTEWPVVGVQFHPESILTEQGHRLLANFLQEHGAKGLAPPPTELGPPPAPVSTELWNRLPVPAVW